MWHSLSRLAVLPPATNVYCAHEYTQANLRFALAVEPDNTALQARALEVAELRRDNLPTVPSSIAMELATNPFLRPRSATVSAAARRFRGADVEGDEAVFAALREWKNNF
jgi:hydroxyacylglutathione hydrolase